MTDPVRQYDAVVAELLEQINMGRSFDDLFNGVYERLRGVVPYHRIAVALLDAAGEHLQLISCHSDGPVALKIGYADPVAGSTLQELLRTGQPRIINDLAAYLEHKPESRSTRLIVREGMRANLTLPLLAGGKPIGVVFFSSREPGVYTEQHARLLRRLAGHLAISVEKAQLIDALQERNKELLEANELKEQFLEKLQEEVRRQTRDLKLSEERYRLLVNLGQIVNSSLDLRRVFRRAAEEIHKLFGCDRVSLILTAGADNARHGFALEFQIAPGLPGVFSEPIPSTWVEIPSQSLAGSAAEWVLQHRRPRIARRLDQARPFIEDRRLYDSGYRAYVYLPLLCRDEGAGVLGLATRKDNQLDGWDLALLHELSHLLATALDNAAAYTQIAHLKAQLEEENVYLREEIRTEHDADKLIGASAAMQTVRQAIAQVAPTDSTVLIVGETGTGKELIARALHARSGRREHLLVKVNCAALEPGVIRSELFGHEAGAFTGALKRRLGRFEVAEQGSIFLDEIAEVPAETQVLLLRVLQEREIERLGGNDTIPVDVRVIAATNRDFLAAVEAGRFRSDLYYRLNVFPIHVPPLRQRREDIPALVNHFLGHFGRRMNKSIRRVSPATLERLLAYHWPGNVRELENIVERAMIVTAGDMLEVDPTWLSGPGLPAAAVRPAPPPALADLERRAILDALERCAGKIYGAGGAAEVLGLCPTTLYGKMRKHGIRKQPGSRRWA